MNIKCDFCGSMIDERNTSCPHCGAPLSGVNRMASGQPKTIEDLKAWYEAHNLPPEEITRFFIGKNITEPKAFGIYKKENGDCVVYKNKSTGERAIRYQGADEAYAVNELYQRLKTEIANQKGRAHSTSSLSSQQSSDNNQANKKGCLLPKSRKSCGCYSLIAFVIMAIIAIGIASVDSVPSGYYTYDSVEYYNQYGTWYRYDKSTDTWDKTASMSEYINGDNAEKYKSYDHEGTRFESTNWYDDGESSSSSDWDNSSSWDDDDDWSSSSTDWDDDW